MDPIKARVVFTANYFFPLSPGLTGQDQSEHTGLSWAEAPIKSGPAQPSSSQLLSIRAGQAGLGFDLWNDLTAWLTWPHWMGWSCLTSPHSPVLISWSKSAWNIFIWYISDRGLGGTLSHFSLQTSWNIFTVLSLGTLGQWGGEV